MNNKESEIVCFVCNGDIQIQYSHSPYCRRCFEEFEKADALYKITQDYSCYEGIYDIHAKAGGTHFSR